MKLKDISRTATFAWDPASGSIATGAVAGALDESFSNESQLEIWSPRFYDKDGSDTQGFQLGEKGKAGPEGSVNVASRFNRLAWSQPGATASGRGMIAAGMETGELFLYDPVKILEGADAQVFKSDKHTGPVRGLDFNPIQKNLLLSGAVNAELFIYDLNNPGTPLPPGPLSTKLNEITALQWNTTVSRVFAASSSSGYTSVWDLRASKEIVSLQYGGGAAKGDMSGYSAGLQMGKRRGMSDVCWHPEQATRLITASEDDESPIIMLWDLRNTRAPERILSGHSKGVLSVAWCQQDPDLLASCGKDNRTLLWNPQTGDMVGELPRTSDWAFEVKWDPRNPNFLGTASFDGHIGIHSLQATQVEEDTTPALPESANADDIFSALGQSDQNDSKANVQSLTVAPKWMRRPVSATFGYGGLLTTVSNLPVGASKPQTSTVNLRTVVTEEALLDRAKELDEIASDKSKLSEFSSNRDGAAWKALRTLFQANTRDELVALLGFSKEEVAQKVQEVVKKLAPELEAKKDKDKTPEPATKGDETPKTDKPATEIPSITTSSSEASALFGDDRPFTPAEAGGEADFFASMASGSLRNPQLDAIVPHTNAAADSSVAATIGSGASSLRSEVIGRDNNFSIYPPGESDTDKLITQALVLGDFKSAVDLCVASDRFADALLLAVRGGQELLEATQKAYFTRRTMEHPFLRIFQSIVTEDLADIVQNADLAEWRVVFVVLCTFAKDADFANLADQLGQRLQFKWQLLAASDSPEAKESARTARQDATLCYLAARNLERIVSIWVSEMQEEEEQSNSPLYSAHAKALQSFIEKVTVFRVATGYVDKDLQSTTPSADAGARTYGLAGLYDRFYEYADLLATQGLVDIAAKYVQMTPAGYVGSSAVQNLDKARQRLLTAAGVSSTAAASSSGIGKTATANKQATAGRPGHSYNASYGGGYNVPYGQTQPGPYGAPASQQNQPFARPPSASATRGYGQPPAPTSGPYAPPPSTQTAGPYAPPPSKQPQQQQQQSAPGPYGPPPTQQHQQQQQQPGPFGGPPKPGAYAPQSQPGQQSRPGPYGAPAQQQSYGAPSQPGPYAPAQSSSYAPPAQQNAYGPNGAFPGVQSQGYGQQQTSAYQPQFPAGNLPPPPRANESQSSGPPVVPASQRRDLPGWNDAPSLATKRPSSATRESTPKPAAIVSPFPMGEQPAHMGGAYPPGPGGPPPPGPAGAALPPPPRGGPRPPSTGPQYAQPPPPGQHAFSPPPQARPPPQGGPRAGPPPPGAAGGPPPRARSPLSPGGARSAQQFGAFSPPPPQGRPLAGPPPPGSRLAGPPPPSHHAAAPMPGQSPPQAASPPAQPAQPPAPAKHPAGDRSHLSASGRPVYEGLSKELQRIKDTNPPARLTKIVNDTERRLNILFDDLNNDDIGDETVGQLGQIVQAINARDANSALAMHVDLLTTATGNTVHWAPGIKQLIRLGI